MYRHSDRMRAAGAVGFCILHATFAGRNIYRRPGTLFLLLAVACVGLGGYLAVR